MIEILGLNEELQCAVREVLSELANAENLKGTFRAERMDEGLRVSKDGGEGRIWFSTKASLMRAIGLIAVHNGEGKYDITQKPQYERLVAMPDMSRNAVMRVDAVKKMCRMVALAGYNGMMLYTEDTYEIEGQPYFGHLRGRYTAEELKELDAYCDMLGLEMIPCIQTLAHLDGFFLWPEAAKYNDCSNILLAGEETTYDLIDSMLETMARNVKSRLIHVGLDEAHMLGCGKYMDKFGYKERSKIMAEHVARVVELCKKHGLQPLMWSDMYFRMTNQGRYCVRGSEVPQHIVESVPPEITLVYWDYYATDPAAYTDMFRQHAKFNNPIAFAGGDSSWYGTVPLNKWAVECAKAAAKSLEESTCKDVYVTMWKDNGAKCATFAAMPSWFIYSEACWSGVDTCEVSAAAFMNACLGVDYQAFLDMENVHAVPGRTKMGFSRVTPAEYMFYQNLLLGKFDFHVPAGSGAHFAAEAERLKAQAGKAGQYAYIFETLEAMCRVLAVKAEMGLRLKAAYDAQDKEALTAIVAQIPDLIDRVHAFRRALRTQWLKENKTVGFETLDTRLGGLASTLESAATLLQAYINGELDRIDELEAPRLRFKKAAGKDDDNGVLNAYSWRQISGMLL